MSRSIYVQTSTPPPQEVEEGWNEVVEKKKIDKRQPAAPASAQDKKKPGNLYLISF